MSAFAPIVHPSESPWGQKAFSLFLGDDQEAWAAYDTLELLRRYKGPPLRLLVDQGELCELQGLLSVEKMTLEQGSWGKRAT